MNLKERNDLLIRMDERLTQMAKTQEQILIQTKETNGRVTKLENWKSRLVGGWIVAGIISTLFGAIITTVINLLL
jgi:hypothetical protein